MSLIPIIEPNLILRHALREKAKLKEEFRQKEEGELWSRAQWLRRRFIVDVEDVTFIRVSPLTEEE